MLLLRAFFGEFFRIFEVTFDIDANGILNVSAKDLGTQKEQHITISSPNKLSDAEVEKFVKDAEKFAEEDKKHKEVIEAKNQGDSVLYQTEKALKDYGDKVSQEDRLAIDRALNDLRDALKTEDAAKMKAATDAALQASQKLGEAMYKNTQANAQAGAQQAAGAQPGANAQAGAANGGDTTTSSSINVKPFLIKLPPPKSIPVL